MVCGYFPEEILLKLPIKSLIRCIAVCKSWNFLIKSPSFIQTQLSRTIQSNNQNQAQLLLLREIDPWNAIFSLYWDNPNSFDVCRTLTGLSAIDTTAVSLSLESFDVLGICNGLVCLSNYSSSIALIWNPLVRKFVILPSPSVTVTMSTGIAGYAFGYDSRTNDYKVLRTVIYNSDQKQSHAEVWSLQTTDLQRANWRSLDAALIPPDFRPEDNYYMHHPLVNGALHWVNRPQGVIETFDMSDELFGRIMMPELLTKDVYTFITSKCRESLALLCYTGIEKLLHVWVMQEYGVTESWTLVSSLPLQGWLSRPLCFGESGELVLGIGADLQAVDLKSEEGKQIRAGNVRTDYIGPYVESLVLLGEPNALSY